MKTKILMLATLATGLLVTTGCNDDNYMPEDIYLKAFEQKYQGASRVEWENKYGYKVAEFHYNGKESEAWFDEGANWLLTETDLRYNDLPAAVQNGFKATEYANWRVDDVDKIERMETETVYVIEVEKGKQEYDLYFNEEGTLIKTTQEAGNGEHLPIVVSQAMKDKIRQLYPNASSILDVDREGAYWEIEIKDGKTYKEVYFNTAEEWVFTKWEIRKADVPQVVLSALNSSQYGGYKIDDIDVIHTPEGMFYLFELEKSDKDYYCLISESGEITTDIPAVMK
ncbi:PepSY-like domain-containing protein [Parabacteroides sp. OttesenSCG-928-G06]|nr:PepSY-like domain-containing protein [Parabacteroides sp. OttesenSCG-928-K15]MDL2281813.1 PepSY-like domain-containing protein [Parabacteroides sp. OttesenSCG-928-G06]